MGRNLPKPVVKTSVAVVTDSTSTGTTSDYTQFLTTIAKNPSLITGYSKLLKTAGYYKGKITDRYTPALQTAFNKAEEARLSIFAVNPMDRNTFLAQPADASAGNARPSTQKSIVVSTDTEAKAFIDAIIQDALGRKATAAEVKKYTASLQAVQKKSPTITKYSTSGGITSSTTTGGFGRVESQQYLLDQVAGTDEAKANKVLGFYDTFMNALGGK